MASSRPACCASVPAPPLSHLGRTAQHTRYSYCRPAPTLLRCLLCHSLRIGLGLAGGGVRTRTPSAVYNDDAFGIRAYGEDLFRATGFGGGVLDELQALMSGDRSDVLSVIIGKCFRPNVEVGIPLFLLSGFSPFLEPDQDDVVARNGYNPRDLKL